MPCSRCGRQVRRLKTARGPDGRLLFDWCVDCLHELQKQTLGLAEINAPGDIPTRLRDMNDPWSTLDQSRAGGLRMLALILACLGMVLGVVAAMSWFADATSDTRLGPTGVPKGPIFAVAGGVLATAGIWLGLISVDANRRRRIIGLAIEFVAVAVGFGTLILGILFHEAKRNPLIIFVVSVAAIVAVASRQRRKQVGEPASSRTMSL
jgi:hypothetical protein